MKTSTRFALRTIALALAIAGSAATSSIAHAGAKCPNRFFKKVQVKGIGDTEANAKTAYDDDLAKKNRRGEAGLRQARMRRQRQRKLHFPAHAGQEAQMHSARAGVQVRGMDTSGVLLPGPGRRAQMTACAANRA